MKMKKEIKTLKTLFLVLGLMIILVVVVGRVRAEGTNNFYDSKTGAIGGGDGATGTGQYNTQLPSEFQGKVSGSGGYYDSASNTVGDKQGCTNCKISADNSFSKISFGSCDGEGEDGEESEKGKGILSKADAAVSAVLGMISAVASIMGPLGQKMQTTEQTTTNSQPGSTDLSLDSSGAQAGYTATNPSGSSAATGGGTAGTTTATTGKAIADYLIADDSGIVGVLLSRNNKASTASTSVREMGKLLADSINLEVEIKKQTNVFTRILTPDGIKTEVTLEQTSGSPAPYIDSGSGYLGSSSVTGKAISLLDSGQFVRLKNYDLDVSGEKIGVETFKSFDNVEANGANLGLKDGETVIEFNKQKTYYSREIKDTPYFINKITNENDGENYFRLLQGGSNGNHLIDSTRRTTVGDIVISHPDATMKGIIIANERKEMFEKGLMAKR